MKCPNCNLEVDENLMHCPRCQTELQQNASEPVESALLMTAKDDIQANIVESLLKVYGIPMQRKYKGNDTFGKIIMGLTVNGIDLYVPKSALEEARDIIENEVQEEELEPEIEEIEETHEELEVAKEHYESKRRFRARLALLFFIPAIIVLAGAAIYWIITLII